MELSCSDNVEPRKNVDVLDDVTNIGEIEIVELKVGMEFDTVDEMYELYRKYAKQKGFPIKKRSSKKDNGVLRHVCFACCREGKHKTVSETPLQSEPTSKIGCKAKLTARLDMDEKWRISVLVLDHNHETSPSKSRFWRCNKKISNHVKKKLLPNDKAEIRMHKNSYSLVVEAGGYENVAFEEKDCRNIVEKERHLKLREGDPICVLLRNDITLLPEKYILRRWRKDVRRSHMKIPINSDGWQLTPDQMRYNELCSLFAELADAASPIDHECSDIKKWIDEKLKAITEKISSNGSTSRLNIETETINSEVNETEKVLDPPIEKRKGRPREKRLEPTRYKKKRKSGKRKIEVNDKTPTQESMANMVQPSGVYRAPNSITYEQYHKLLVAQLSRDGHAVNVAPAYGAPQLWGSAHFTNATSPYGITQRHGASSHFANAMPTYWITQLHGGENAVNAIPTYGYHNFHFRRPL